jgi:hypothetical protein
MIAADGDGDGSTTTEPMFVGAVDPQSLQETLLECPYDLVSPPMNRIVPRELHIFHLCDDVKLWMLPQSSFDFS